MFSNNLQLMMDVCLLLSEKTEMIGRVQSSCLQQVKELVCGEKVLFRCWEWERTKGARKQCGHS